VYFARAAEISALSSIFIDPGVAPSKHFEPEDVETKNLPLERFAPAEEGIVSRIATVYRSRGYR
jgi:hypothetical protein